MLHEPNPLVLTGLAIFLSWLIRSYYNSEAWRVSPNFSTLVGFSRVRLAEKVPNCWFCLAPPFYRWHSQISHKCSRPCGDRHAKGESVHIYFALLLDKLQWPGRNFKIPSPTGWRVVITNPKLIEDIKKAPDHVLSHKEAIRQVCSLFQSVKGLALRIVPSKPDATISICCSSPDNR
jgi:hypothetical protein